MATPKRSSTRSVSAQRRPRQPRAAQHPRPRATPKAAFSTRSGRVDARLIEGIARFNHHQFFASHEVLEQLWLATDDRAKDFYKGLIQAAVACFHWSRGNLGGAMSLYRSSSRYLRKFRPTYLSVNVEEFLERYTELFGWLHRHRTRYDPRLVPTIRWTHGQ